MAEENNNNKTAVEPTTSAVTSPAKPSSTVVPATAKPIALIALLLSLAALLLMLLISYHLYQRGHAANGEITALQNKVQQQQTALAQMQPLQQWPTELNRAKQGLTQHLEQQSTELERLNKTLLGLADHQPNDWLLAEANYLVRLAGHKLWLEHDLVSAQLLLREADSRLAELNDPSLTPIRGALAKDLATLQALPHIDRSALALRLSALAAEVKDLPLKGIILPPLAEPTQQNQLSADPGDWLSNLAKTWRSFVDDFITIRQRTADVEALLPPDQRWYLQENLRGKLQLAQLALFREQQVVYRDALTSASRWIDDYFQADEALGQAMLQALQQLQSQPIAPQYPDDFAVRKPLQRLLDQRINRWLDNAAETRDGAGARPLSEPSPEQDEVPEAKGAEPALPAEQPEPEAAPVIEEVAPEGEML